MRRRVLTVALTSSPSMVRKPLNCMFLSRRSKPCPSPKRWRRRALLFSSSRIACRVLQPPERQRCSRIVCDKLPRLRPSGVRGAKLPAEPCRVDPPLLNCESLFVGASKLADAAGILTGEDDAQKDQTQRDGKSEEWVGAGEAHRAYDCDEPDG